MLRELRIEDSNDMLEWMHDPDIQRCFQKSMITKTIKDVEFFIRDSSMKEEHGKSINFAIADDNDEYMGTISLKNIDMNCHNAEYSISLRKKAQGRGIAYKATQEILKYAFEEIRLKRVYLNVFSDNLKAIRLYERCGFIYEGEFRKHLIVDGNYKDLRWYSMLREEYLKLNGSTLS